MRPDAGPRAAKAFEREASRRRIVNLMVKIADQMGISDDTELLPRLYAIAAGNVVAITPKE
jgi:hypothetical protein